MEKEILLQLCDISVHYGGTEALNGIDISLKEGEIVALMGPNGAGKSTVLKTIFGLTPIHSGKVFWHDEHIKFSPREAAQNGISFVPQGRRVFNQLTVEENLEVGSFVIINDKYELKRRIVEMMETFPILKEKCKTKAGTLSGGQQQMLALARGLITEPKVLLLDEPSLGLTPKIVKEVFSKVKEINEKHKTAILIVENNIELLLKIASRGYVLDKGRIIARDSSQKLLESGILKEVFMGNGV